MKLLAIIRAEFWQRRWSLLWWCIGISFFIGLNLAVYPSFRQDAAELDSVLAGLPDSLKSLFSDSGDFLSPVGFLSSQIYYLMAPLMFSIFAIVTGASLLAREEQNGTIELLLSRPLSRGALLLGKALFGLLALMGVTTVAACVAVMGVQFTDLEVSRLAVIITTYQAMLLSLVFGALAFTLTAVGRAARRAAAGIAALCALGSYLITSLQGTVQWLRWPAKVLPYYYYHPSEILRGVSANAPEAIGFSIVILALMAVAWAGFRRRDIA